MRAGIITLESPTRCSGFQGPAMGHGIGATAAIILKDRQMDIDARVA